MGELARKEKDLSELVMERLSGMAKENTVAFPRNYSPENAVRAAWLIINQPMKVKGKEIVPADYCTKKSISNVILNMALNGLTAAKSQCYFIPYGQRLTLSISVYGKIAIAKRDPNIKDIKAYPIFQGDEFETEFDYLNASLKIKKYVPSFKMDEDKQLIGAFAVIVGTDDILHTEVMNISQLKKSWAKAKANYVHNDFPGEMAKKTVIHRALKMYNNTTDDSFLDFGVDEVQTDEELIQDIKEESQDEVDNNIKNAEIIDVEVSETKSSEENEENKPKEEVKEPVKKTEQVKEEKKELPVSDEAEEMNGPVADEDNDEPF